MEATKSQQKHLNFSLQTAVLIAGAKLPVESGMKRNIAVPSAWAVFMISLLMFVETAEAQKVTSANAGIVDCVLGNASLDGVPLRLPQTGYYPVTGCSIARSTTLASASMNLGYRLSEAARWSSLMPAFAASSLY
jgi:hypothetical protein